MIPLPNDLFENGRSVLAKFGYKHLDEGETREDWADMWELLRGDFRTVKRPEVPRYAELNEAQQEAARLYMTERLLADRLLENCEELHGKLFEGGINTDLVEDYTQARFAYEDRVEGFGDAGEKLSELLPVMA